MNANMKWIWLNRAFNTIASASFLGSAAGAVVELGEYADKVRALGIALPQKWVAILLFVGAAGHIAAKLSKTMIAAIAAAVPPGQAPVPPPPPSP